MLMNMRTRFNFNFRINNSPPITFDLKYNTPDFKRLSYFIGMTFSQKIDLYAYLKVNHPKTKNHFQMKRHLQRKIEINIFQTRL